MSTAIRSTLQRTIFQPDDERLVAVANFRQDIGGSGGGGGTPMTANKKKKKEVFVCLVVTIEQPVAVRIYFVKRNEKDDQLKKKEQFALRDVRVVDGINPRKPLPEFNMVIKEKQYQLATSTYDEKEAFIRQLYKLANSYLPVQKPDFINLTLPVDTSGQQSMNNISLDQSAADGDTLNGADNDNLTDYQPISAKEEADFRRLLAKSNLEIGKARQFANALNEQLMLLDGANIESIMGSEVAVTNLIELIDRAVDEATKIEKQLDEYDDLLAFVRDSVELIEEKDSLGHIERTNTKRLTQELSDFIYMMDQIHDGHINVLKCANLSDPTSINLCCQAARVLNSFLSKKTDLMPMGAYQERLETMHKVTADFVDRLYAHTTTLFDNMESMLEHQTLGEIMLQKHSQRHRALLPFSDLISWLKLARPNVYQNALERYKASAGELYKREFERFFTELAHKANRLALETRRPLKMDMEPWTRICSEDMQRYILCNFNSITSNELPVLLQLLETAIAECRTVVEGEQKFCTRFFHLNAELLASLETSSHGSGDSAGLSNNSSGGGKSLERQQNDQIKAVIGPIFEMVPVYICRFAALCKEQHPLVIISMFVVLTKRINTYQDTGSYFSVLYGSSTVGIKRLFDEQMKKTEHSLANVKIAKRMRVGILDTINSFRWGHEDVGFEEQGFFQVLGQVIGHPFAQSERRNDLDRWHEKLADAVVQGINAAADSHHSKYPPAVVRFENLHQLYSVLSELKVECLDSRRKAVKKMYQENMQAYVADYMGKPLREISSFFDQVERAISQGKKPEEIAYEQAYGRMELKKVISMYPAREVKKGIDNLYKKVEKHLCSQSPLLQVVWRDMQDEFLKQLKHYQELIGRCYPAPRIELEILSDTRSQDDLA